MKYSINWIRVADNPALHFGEHYWERVACLKAAEGTKGGPPTFIMDVVSEIIRTLKRRRRGGDELGLVRFEWQHREAPWVGADIGPTLIFAPPTMASLAAYWQLPALDIKLRILRRLDSHLVRQMRAELIGGERLTRWAQTPP